MLLVRITTRGKPNPDNAYDPLPGTSCLTVVASEDDLDLYHEDAETYESVKIIDPIDIDDALGLIKQLAMHVNRIAKQSNSELPDLEQTLCIPDGENFHVIRTETHAPGPYQLHGLNERDNRGTVVADNADQAVLYAQSTFDADVYHATAIDLEGRDLSMYRRAED